jgi:hypothetical protein
MNQELQRLEQNKTGEQPHGLRTTLIIDLGDKPDQTYDRIIDVSRLLARYGTYWGSKTDLQWPSGPEWKQLLPQWFLATFRDYSKEDCEKMMAETPRQRWGELPWLFESWTELMNNRTWEWWSSRRKGKTLEIQLLLEGWPYSVGSLEYLIKSAGASSVELNENPKQW